MDIEKKTILKLPDKITAELYLAVGRTIRSEIHINFKFCLIQEGNSLIVQEVSYFKGKCHRTTGRVGPRGFGYVKATDFLDVRYYKGGRHRLPLPQEKFLVLIFRG
jgi:hypothetical protein